MFFLPHQLDILCADTTPDLRDQELQEELRGLPKRLAEERSEYRHFGPYWWWVKPLVRSAPAARRSWFRGGFVDRGFLGQVEPAVPGRAGHGDPQEESRRWIAWLGLQYYRAEILDETPAAMHIVERSDGTAFIYRLYDADASEQIDLFSDPRERKEHREFLADPGRFSGSTWLQRADRYINEGDLLRGAASLRRAVDRAISEEDRTTAWIRLGQLFQEHRHTAKAILCYHNAWERDREGWIQGLIAEAYLDNDQPHLALDCYRSALKAMPGNPEYQAGLERCRRIAREREAGYSFTAEPLAN